MRFSFGVLFVVLAACAPEVSDDTPAIVTEVVSEDGLEENATEVGGLEVRIPELEQCDAEEYRPLIGTPVAATTFATSDRLRVYGANDIITQDYLPQRTNVVYDAEGLITRVSCG